ncbi:MAG: putative zinc finger/helix-turn-helix protein YgiT family [Clostridia bacterium]|jgi:putative zinc finger/helix-turn-helix YgiT family protein|nr:putative zinc finger/helix-turn-helix protein YgiT family [Clostridia bacterium]
MSLTIEERSSDIYFNKKENMDREVSEVKMRICEECRKFVEATLMEKEMEKEIRGKQIKYIGKAAYCNECGNELFDSEINDYNLEQMDAVFRENEGLIKINRIEEILRKYDIGKRPLSLLLNWGELTLSRYLDGALPTPEYSEKLLSVLYDSNEMEKLLEMNKNNITDTAYKKCKASLKKNNNICKPENKINSAALYILVKSDEITPLALQKILYYVQAFNNAFFGNFMFEDDCEAWVHGPVYVSIYKKYKDYGYNPIEKKLKCDDINFNLFDNEKEVLNNVIKYFGCYSGRILEKMTHSERPWSLTRNGIGSDEASELIIKKELIAEYFKDVKDNYKLLNVSDIGKYSRSLFNKLI